MTIQRGDVVATKLERTHHGLVNRVAKDGKWADVDWGGWTKRMRIEHLVKPTEVPMPGLSGDGLTVTLLQFDGEAQP